MFHSLRAACVAAALLCALPAGMWGQRVCLSGCDDGNKVVQRFDPVAAQRMFDEAFETIDSLTVAGDSLQALVDSMGVVMDTLFYRLDTLTTFIASRPVLGPPTVTTDSASTITSGTANLNAAFLDGGLAVTATGFRYDTTATLSSLSAAVIPGSGISSPFTAALTGLASNTQYWAVAFATNPAGTSYGDTITFTTTAGCSVSSVTYQGYTYPTVTIGTDCWFAANLRSTHYNDGSAIDSLLSAMDWGVNTTSGAQAVYAESLPITLSGNTNAAANLSTHGRLYNWYAVNDPRGLCPSGWHVSTNDDWNELTTALGGSNAAGDKIRVTSWSGTNTSGFNGTPNGYRYRGDTGVEGTFDGEGQNGYWWTSTPGGTFGPYFRYLGIAPGFVLTPTSQDPHMGYGVRCVAN
jgi:uncharacterized protein (TIGR02145 family)